MELIFYLLVLIFSTIFHEVAHGYMANWLGDPTARLAGRLTLNPISHIDPMGSVILPALMFFSQPLTHFPVLIGYAKPVPYNPYNLPGRFDEGLVAAAGPGTNVLIALIFSLIVRFSHLSQSAVDAFALVIYLNLLLAIFNLIPIPPLDGSKVLSSILPGELGRAYDRFRNAFERLGILTGTFVVLIAFYFLMPYFSVVIQGVFRLFTGLQV